MNVILQHERAVLLIGDCKNLSEALPDNSVDAIVTDPPSGIEFMGVDWDNARGGRDAWSAWLADTIAASYRALKPGGYMACWALPRTSHWTARGIELAGFQIRDLHHEFTAADSMLAQFTESLDDAQRDALMRIVESQSSPVLYQIFGTGFPKSLTHKSAPIPASTGTALKPAVEHWILARKPFGGTVGVNLNKWGTGVLNIEGARAGGRWPAHVAFAHSPGCRLVDQRVEMQPMYGEEQMRADDNTTNFAMASQTHTGETVCVTHDVFECVDGCPVRTLDDQSSVVGSKGGASRFFYIAKASRSEKDAGLSHLETSTGGEATGRKDDSAGTRNPRAGAGRTGGARNTHPTAKNVALMTWLIKLITPPGGVVLDPFAGSGTTGVAALMNGFSFIGIDTGGPDGKYTPILLGRIAHALEQRN